MSFLLRTITRNAAIRPIVSSRGFTASSFRALKEDDTNRPNQAEENEKHKQDQLQKQKEGKGHWKPELASNSEEAVAADRSKNDDSPEELQRKTAGKAEEKHKYGTSQDSGL